MNWQGEQGLIPALRTYSAIGYPSVLDASKCAAETCVCLHHRPEEILL